MPRVSRVKLGERAGRDPFEHLLRKDPKELPPDVEGLEYRPVIAVQFVFSNFTNSRCLSRQFDFKHVHGVAGGWGQGFVDLMTQLLWELHTFSNVTIQPS